MFLTDKNCIEQQRFNAVHECFCTMTEWKPEHFSDVAVLLSKCEDVYSADVPSSLQVSLLNRSTLLLPRWQSSSHCCYLVGSLAHIAVTSLAV